MLSAQPLSTLLSSMVLPFSRHGATGKIRRCWSRGYVAGEGGQALGGLPDTAAIPPTAISFGANWDLVLIEELWEPVAQQGAACGTCFTAKDIEDFLSLKSISYAGGDLD